MPQAVESFWALARWPFQEGGQDSQKGRVEATNTDPILPWADSGPSEGAEL